MFIKGFWYDELEVFYIDYPFSSGHREALWIRLNRRVSGVGRGIINLEKEREILTGGEEGTPK